MTKTIKKTYIAPAAELILLAPLEALAAPSLTQDDNIALNKWGYKGIVKNASVTGGKRTYWGEDGRIHKK
ncbi:MAG: hypothetical protein MSS53_06575 [Oscillibacter sp.]|nr:hypothetical protein [Oscillibacter sp.]